ncbi:formate/nitrite transporter family protein [Acetobacter pasteurianus]|nr:formate/nitrite transporter family protein [Acetobacter pasteurianus]
MDDNSYLTTYEAALAVVATAMKKARLQIDVLIVNSIIAGMLFSTGGMLTIVVQGLLPEIYKQNPGILHMLSGLFFPLGLFYVVVMGVDLFNSNILFFSCALCRGAVSIVDLLISWFVSYWFNLVGNIFVGFIIFHYSNTASTTDIVNAARELAFQKAAPLFVQTLLRASAGNFFVCMAIYLQLMVKPLHVKFLMMVIPVFSFVTLGYTHAVADMTILIIGKIEGAPVAMAKLAWKVFVPAALGNIIGGSFFGIVICWYLHLFVVERDKKKLNLPQYEFRDEQPELNQDSRVVRRRKPQFDGQIIDNQPNDEDDYGAKKVQENEKLESTPPDSLSSSENDAQAYEPIGLSGSPHSLAQRERTSSGLSRVGSQNTMRSISSARSSKSPKGVFPVYGMGAPAARERSIADGSALTSRKNSSGEPNVTNVNGDYGADYGASGDSNYNNNNNINNKNNNNNNNNDDDDDDQQEGNNAEYIGAQLKRLVTGKSFTSNKKNSDLEARPRLGRSSTIGPRPTPRLNTELFSSNSSIDSSASAPVTVSNSASTNGPHQHTITPRQSLPVGPKENRAFRK